MVLLQIMVVAVSVMVVVRVVVVVMVVAVLSLWCCASTEVMACWHQAIAIEASLMQKPKTLQGAHGAKCGRYLR